MSKKKIVVIGAGISGLSAACNLAFKGYEVTVLEKNNSIGGRARRYTEKGFVFDMGPSWYWMPDVFEEFFQRLGRKREDYYQIERLDPSYRVFFKEGEVCDIPADINAYYDLFEKIEPGSSTALKKFLEEAEYKYSVGMKDLVYKPGLSLFEFADLRILKGILKLDVFKSFYSHVRSYFKDPRLIQLLEFPVLFLGEIPKNTPALYSLMNHADINLGTWYPVGGMYKIIEAFEKVALELGVKIVTNQDVETVIIKNDRIHEVKTKDSLFSADMVVGSADYAHIDRNILPSHYRQYDNKYWDTRKLAPSCLIYYLGISKTLSGLLHHNLFFDQDFEQHADTIYTNPDWPKNPLFYVSVVSKTDQAAAPADHENVFVLIPVAPGLQDSKEIRDQYYDLVMERMENITKQNIKDFVVYKKTYAMQDFVNDYNALKGNAYGLANTLLQTAILKPKIRNKKLKNLFYAGQLTVPGPGVPPGIISGQVVADLIANDKKLNS